MRRLGSSLALCGLLAVQGAAAAQPCHVEPMPAATLLLPYFEVDLSNANGMQTLLSINNAATQPVLAKVEMWSDLAVPVVGFMLYLKGDDVQTINLHDIFISGVLPSTAPPAGAFPGCAGYLPAPNIPAAIVPDLQHAFTGKPIVLLGGACAGRDLGDNLARGYITVDTVADCTGAYQGGGVFVNGGTGQFTNQNVLWGDYYYVNSAVSQVEGHPLVHIAADATNPSTSVPGEYTFYGSFDHWSAADNRVPLATNFAARYFNVAGLLQSDFIVWRDPKFLQSFFPCGTLPPWYPLGQSSIIAFDEDGHSTALSTTSFPAAAQRVHVGGSALPMPYASGWLFLDLNTFVGAAGSNQPADALADQAWVTATMSSGALQLGVDSIRLDNACNPRHTGL